MNDSCKSCEWSRQGACVFCGKPKQDIPPGQNSRMCQDCWATKTEDGQQWAHEFYAEHDRQDRLLQSGAEHDSIQSMA